MKRECSKKQKERRPASTERKKGERRQTRLHPFKSVPVEKKKGKAGSREARGGGRGKERKRIILEERERQTGKMGRFCARIRGARRGIRVSAGIVYWEERKKKIEERHRGRHNQGEEKKEIGRQSPGIVIFSKGGKEGKGKKSITILSLRVHLITKRLEGKEGKTFLRIRRVARQKKKSCRISGSKEGRGLLFKTGGYLGNKRAGGKRSMFYYYLQTRGGDGKMQENNQDK